MESPGTVPQRVPLYPRCPHCGYVMKGLEVAKVETPGATAVTARCEECGWAASTEMSTIELAEAVGESDLLLDAAPTPEPFEYPAPPSFSLLDRPVFPAPSAGPTPVRKATTTTRRRALTPLARRRPRPEALVLVALSFVAITTGLVQLVRLHGQLEPGVFLFLVAVLLPVTVALFVRGLRTLWYSTR